MKHVELGLPIYYAIHTRKGNAPKTEEAMDIFRLIHGEIHIGTMYNYYGYVGKAYEKRGTVAFNSPEIYTIDIKIFTPEEFLNIVNQKPHVKLGLPLYYAIHFNSREDETALYAIKWFNKIHNAFWGPYVTYLGFDGSKPTGVDSHLIPTNFKNKVTILTPEEFVEIVDKNTAKNNTQMKHSLKAHDAVRDITPEKWELIKSIAKQNGINTTSVFLSKFEECAIKNLRHFIVYSSPGYPNQLSIQDEYPERYNFIPFEKFLLKMMGKDIKAPIEVKLNEDYKAIVTEENVTVDCQTFTHQKITELYNAIKSFEQ